MNQIKFRAWDKKNGIMRDWEYVRTNWTLSILNGDANTEIMQYTGIEDKNGKEIYFGDVVRFSFVDIATPEASWGGTATVWDKIGGGAGLLANTDLGNTRAFAVLEGGQIEDFWPDESMWNVEVIGNIHENPDLIKQPA